MSSSHQPTAPSTSSPHEQNDDVGSENFRDIHALSPPLPPPPGPNRSWEIGIHGTRSTSTSSQSGSSENFTTISREFNSLVLAGSAIHTTTNPNNNNNNHEINTNNEGTAPLGMIGEDDEALAIVPDTNPMGPRPGTRRGGAVQRVKEEEVEAKISAWENAKVAKINNRFKREDAVINGWENEQVQEATSWMKKIERKLEENRARAFEKMQNKIAKAHRKAEERRATAEGKRGTKLARVLELANSSRAVGRGPAKCCFF